MITIDSYARQMLIDGEQYKVVIKVDGLDLVQYLDISACEVTGSWNTAKAQAYLDARYAELLQLAREKNIQVSNQILEAPDFRVASPKISKDLRQVRLDIAAETKKPSKSIAYLALAQAKLIEDLTQRVEKLEQAKLQFTPRKL